ncbi:MAG: hypothetical protein U9N51_07175 [Bacteroidota bacterium]|nr:hypothetical protein [Bacteroidota bacterium]
MNKIVSIFAIAFIMTIVAINSYAQNDEQTNDGNLSDQQVTVVTTYTPVINDAFRLERLPKIVDTFFVEPRFKYNIFSKMQPTILYPTPLQAAKLQGESKDHLENGYAKLAVGSKLNLNAELYYMNTRNSSTNWGVIGKHQSAQGKVDIPDGSVFDGRVFAGYDVSNIGAFVKKMYSHTMLKADINFGTSQHFFYGYTPANLVINSLLLPNDRDDFIDGNHRQRYSVLSVNTAAKSRFPQIKKINYEVGLSYDLWFDANQNLEHTIDFSADLHRKIKKEMVGLSTEFILIPAKYLDPSLMYIDLSPYLKHNSENFKLKLGLKTKMQFLKDSSDFHFYPDVHIEHNIANVILPYASFTGNLMENSMRELTRVNPYINDTLAVSPANVKQNICVGIKGRISDAVQFNINGQYRKEDNQHFFVTDYSSTLENRFGIVYSDLELFKAYAELNFEFGDKMKLRLHGLYNHYTWLKNIDEAWQIPIFRSGLYAEYQVLPQLNVHANAFVDGKRIANLSGDTQWSSVEMDPVIDVNLGADYQVSNQLSAFVALNNLAGQNYEIWYQYPVYGFHFLGGIKYGF